MQLRVRAITGTEFHQDTTGIEFHPDMIAIEFHPGMIAIEEFHPDAIIITGIIITGTATGIMEAVIIVSITGDIHLCMVQDILLFQEAIFPFVLAVTLTTIIMDSFMAIIPAIINPYFLRLVFI